MHHHESIRNPRLRAFPMTLPASNVPLQLIGKPSETGPQWPPSKIAQLFPRTKLVGCRSYRALAAEGLRAWTVRVTSRLTGRLK